MQAIFIPNTVKNAVMPDKGDLIPLTTLLPGERGRVAVLGHGRGRQLRFRTMGLIELGLGCNVPGALATRVLETKKQRFIAATLMAIAVPCMAQSATIFGVLGKFGIK